MMLSGDIYLGLIVAKLLPDGSIVTAVNLSAIINPLITRHVLQLRLHDNSTCFAAAATHNPKIVLRAGRKGTLGCLLY